MQYQSIPTCYFPTTTLFVDDNRGFLLSFVLQLDENIAYQVFDSPINALACIRKQHCEFDALNQRCLSEYTEAKLSPFAEYINLDMAAIHAEVYNPKRFSEVSVVVVDDMMSEMSGLEFCKRIDDANIKKILLTSQADEQFAKEALNQGLIHYYIKKNDPHADELITQNIQALQFQYFQQMSDMVRRMLPIQSPRCLEDKKFIDSFQVLLRERGIVEYYMADHSGSFLMLDADANISCLIVKSAEDVKWHHQLALQNGTSVEVLEQIETGKKIPCFWQANTSASQWGEWADCLVPALSIVSDQTYFYAYVQGPVLFDLCQEKILSYHQFMDVLDAEELLAV